MTLEVRACHRRNAMARRQALSQDCKDRYDKTYQHGSNWHSDEHGQRAVGVLQEIQVYFAHSFSFVTLFILTHCG